MISSIDFNWKNTTILYPFYPEARKLYGLCSYGKFIADFPQSSVIFRIIFCLHVAVRNVCKWRMENIIGGR